MESIRGHDRWLDPPEEATHWKCNRCGVTFDGGDLNYIKGEDIWLCDEDFEDYKQLEAEDR